MWIFFHVRFLEFKVHHKFQLHLSKNKLFGVGPVVHKGVQFCEIGGAASYKCDII